MIILIWLLVLGVAAKLVRRHKNREVTINNERMRNSYFQEDRNGSVVLASSRHMKEEYEMNMTIPRAKVTF